ncbi:centromere-associated protein E-like [Achroia grisella]|uniref:centromere-associated protein E-like n=1 Tax=Achroia grisella TaxID=688607 RepID=UPI0027D2568C|nr:centromere-associated protein E-like [Achroia grisella]
MTTVKPQKEKSCNAAPRLAPRPTAASAARAARNATNRNLNVPLSQRQSPSRAPSLSTIAKAKSPVQRNNQKSDSKTDIQINRNLDSDLPTFDSFSVPSKPDPDSYVTDSPSGVLIKVSDPNRQTSTDKDQEIDTFEVEQKDVIPNDIVNMHQISDCISTTRPHTPGISSRPQTPKSLQPSRPRTPSRPTTPAHSVQRNCTPVSRPNTPSLSNTNRPKTPTSLPSPTSRVITPALQLQTTSFIKNDKDLKTIYDTKQQQFHRMKKELDMKQQALLEVFDCIRSLRERMSHEGISGDGENCPQNVVVFNVADWATHEITQLCRDAAASSTTDEAIELISTIVPIDECALAELDAKASNVPTKFADLCLQAFTARQELIDWVKELVEKNENGSGESLERIARYNEQGLELCESLRELKSCADDVVGRVIQIYKRASRERSALIAVGESLLRETARLREDIDTQASIVKEMQDRRTETEATKEFEELRHALEEEIAAKLAAKDKLSTTESQLRQARIRVNKMDRQLREAEASIASLTGTVKSLEDQSRQREVQLEARARKLKESLKTGEVTSGQIAHQRDALQAEVLNLKEQIETMTVQHKSTVEDLTNQLKELKNCLEEHKQMTEREIEIKQATKASLIESNSTIEELKTKLMEIEKNRPNPELPTEREMDLWADLQATKDTLRFTEEEVIACKREKVRFLETLTKIAESENKVGMQQKLAAELLSKEEIISKMQTQIRELTKNIKLNEQKVIQYEQYVRDLQAHNRAVADCQEAPDGIRYEDLQQEIFNLRMGLLETVHRNEELSEMLMQREQQLEQQDKTSRAQARVIKVREELINMLKNKETEQSRELTNLQQDLEHRMKIVDEVNKQIAAKADEIQELFSTLENKQQQIHRLEKIVLALEEQQRRAQAQRTRHEEKIAALEHELASGGNRRERLVL